MEKWVRKTDGEEERRGGAYLFERFKRKQVNTKGWWESCGDGVGKLRKMEEVGGLCCW